MTGPNKSQPSFVDQLESLLAHARHLELALNQERRKSRSLQEEINSAHAMFDRLMHEEKARCGELTVEISRVRSQMAEREQQDLAVRERLKAAELQRRQAIEELKQYQTVWAQVLEREREAKTLIDDSRRAIEESRELEQRSRALAQTLEGEKAAREQSERHSQSYQAELQNTLVRLHSSEAKFSELSREIQAIRESRKTLDEEAALDRGKLRENYEKLRLELEGYKKALDAESVRAESLEKALMSGASIQTWVAEAPEIEQAQGEC